MRRISKLFNLNGPEWGRGNQNGSEPPRRPPGGGNGPPDLDEVWRDFNRRIAALFGRKGNQGGRNGGPGGTGVGPGHVRIGAGLILLILVAVWLASGFYIVQEGQVAVVTQFGKYDKTTAAGFQWRLPYPIQNQEIVNVSQLRTFEVGFRGSSSNKVLPESLMLTTDENIVDMQFVVQYRLRADGAPDYLFRTRNPDEAVRQAAETAMREVVGKQPMDYVLYEGRTNVATDVQALMQQILDRYHTGIQISTVAIQNVQPPEQVQAAFDDAVKAGQDRERQINEGEAYANQVVPLAAGQASRLTQEAEGYKAKVIGDAQGNTARFNSIVSEYRKSPAVMRERMYLQTMEDIFSRASKVMIDTRGGNNVVYLPIDKIIQQAAQEGGKPQSTGGSLSLPGATQPTIPPSPRPVTGQSSGNTGSGNTLSRDRLSR
jgi:membrane protease subunit HflK